mgnify:CR=1 FL=1
MKFFRKLFKRKKEPKEGYRMCDYCGEYFPEEELTYCLSCHCWVCEECLPFHEDKVPIKKRKKK